MPGKFNRLRGLPKLIKEVKRREVLRIRRETKRGGGGETGRETDRYRDRQRQRQRDRDRETERVREIDRSCVLSCAFS